MERILVFEFASCSGFKGSILAEGFSMLKLVAEGLRNSGYYTIAIIDSAIMKWNAEIHADKIIETNFHPENITEGIMDIAKREKIDYVFPIAPENELVEIVGLFRFNGIKCIASGEDAIKIAADKWKTYLNLKMAGIETPKTTRIDDIDKIESDFDYPLVIKKRDGISCEDLYKARNRDELKNILKIIKKRKKEKFMAQEFIKGIDASVTVFSDGKKSVAVSLNRQYIQISAHGSEYIGGEVPFNHPHQEEAFRAAESAVNAVSGLIGAIGVDIILSDKPYIIEINPRITTSMIGLRLSFGMNVGDWALRSYLGELPEVPEFSKIIRFSKYFSTKNIGYNEKRKFKNLFAGPVSYSDEIKRGECAGILVEEV